MENTTTPSKRTGGRSAAVIHNVRTAVEELVEEKGQDRVTVPMIAERAGVNPTSIYRRWGDLPTLINDIATYQLDPSRPLPERGDLRADLTEWARELGEHYRNPVNAALLRGGASAAGERQSNCLRNRRIEANLLLERYPDASITDDDILDTVVAPIVYRVIFLPWTLEDTTAEHLVARLFH
ncbi:TetR/AcrR family transcriptional regulator [Leifsonia shinshuensis]|uniref:TetR/AcrR family transcriptional regulator n=1 Tax=Leifsonia shinshuensis TaxID=150026 RepID=UPI002864FE9E|nr:TetR/AcrR family transcriptional regulator [Leifsonia shinshuensis]MDR6972391.1 AcrR family transcriptional regulator [Leifsonia shinshuensis]